MHSFMHRLQQCGWNRKNLISVAQYFLGVSCNLSLFFFSSSWLFIIHQSLKGVYYFIHYSPDIAVLIIIPTFPNQNIHYSLFFIPLIINHCSASKPDFKTLKIISPLIYIFVTVLNLSIFITSDKIF